MVIIPEVHFIILMLNCQNPDRNHGESSDLALYTHFMSMIFENTKIPFVVVFNKHDLVTNQSILDDRQSRINGFFKKSTRFSDTGIFGYIWNSYHVDTIVCSANPEIQFLEKCPFDENPNSLHKRHNTTNLCQGKLLACTTCEKYFELEGFQDHPELNDDSVLELYDEISTEYQLSDPPRTDPNITDVVLVLQNNVFDVLAQVNLIKTLIKSVDGRRRLIANLIENQIKSCKTREDFPSADGNICRLVVELYDLPSTALIHSQMETERWIKQHSTFIERVMRRFAVSISSKNYLRSWGVFYAEKYYHLYRTLQNHDLNGIDAENLQSEISFALAEYDYEKWEEIYGLIDDRGHDSVYLSKGLK